MAAMARRPASERSEVRRPPFPGPGKDGMSLPVKAAEAAALRSLIFSRG
jgi:hypothetical protein